MIVLPCKRKDIVHHLLSGPAVASAQRCSELPLELWSHIFRYLHSYPDLARISRLCRSLQHEAELVLYHSVFLHGDLRIRSFHRAIAVSPRRAGIVRRLMMDDKYNSYPITAGMNEILPLVSGVTTLHIKADWSITYLMDLHLTQLQACTFQLKEFVTNLPVSPAFVRFLELQPHIETLVSISRVDAEASAALPRNVLPALRILNTGREFMNVLRYPRNITHLILWVRLDYLDTHAVDKALWVLRHQLISLKLFRFIHPTVKERIPAYIFRKISAPKLRYLHVWDLITSPWVRRTFCALCTSCASLRTLLLKDTSVGQPSCRRCGPGATWHRGGNIRVDHSEVPI